MKIKRYIAGSMQEAMHKIRRDLGEQAVILNTKEVRSQGLFSFLSRKKFEVVAAAAPKEAVSATTKSMTMPATPYNGMKELSLNQTTDDAAKEIYREIKQIKSWIKQLNMKTGHALPGQMQRLDKYLQEQDFDSQWISQLLESVPDHDDNHSVRLTIEKQLEQFLVQSPASTLSEQTRIAHFVGPTGVGKTTSIAKLAAEQVLNKGRRVGFITSDTYRIAAVEQLRTYAELLNIPLKVVHSPEDLSEATAELQSECDLILMDTAGRNFSNYMYVSEVNRLLETRDQTETYLVLSLTAKYLDMKRIIENFSQFHLDKVLFTKMDETQSCGSIFNILSEYPLKPSYITFGQSVPDDIKVFDPDMVVSRVMEGWKDE